MESRSSLKRTTTATADSRGENASFWGVQNFAPMYLSTPGEFKQFGFHLAFSANHGKSTI
jgi:hypothetical protein